MEVEEEEASQNPSDPDSEMTLSVDSGDDELV